MRTKAVPRSSYGWLCYTYLIEINQVSNKQVGIMFNSDQVTDSLFYVYLPLFSVYVGEPCNPSMNVCKCCCIKSTILTYETQP